MGLNQRRVGRDVIKRKYGSMDKGAEGGQLDVVGYLGKVVPLPIVSCGGRTVGISEHGRQ